MRYPSLDGAASPPLFLTEMENVTGSPKEGFSGCHANVPTSRAKSGLTGTGSRVGVGTGVGVAVGGGGAATRGIGVGEGGKTVAVGDGSTVGVTVGVAVGVSVGVGAATASAGTGMEVGGTGKTGAEPPPAGADTGTSGPNGPIGLELKYSTIPETPHITKLSKPTISSRAAQVCRRLDGICKRRGGGCGVGCEGGEFIAGDCTVEPADTAY